MILAFSAEYFDRNELEMCIKTELNTQASAQFAIACFYSDWMPKCRIERLLFFFFVRYILSLKLTSIQCQGNSTNTKLVLSAQASLIIQ